MICVALFGFSSMLCGLAPSLPLLIFFRVLQGAGGGGLAPSEQAILADTFSPQQRGQAFALYGVAVVMAPAIGPLLGGWITDNFTWRWIFWINLPVTLLSLYLVNRLIERRTFAIPFVFMFVLGFMFYSTLVLIPQYAQTLLGYSAVLAGEVISPGGFALLLTMPLVGFLITKVDARWLMCVGFFTLSTAMALMHTISLESSFRYIMWIRVYQMAGLSFFFIPINTFAYLGVAKGENNDVSGLINLARNIGGSVGTAFVGTMLARGSQQHQAYMVRHITPTSFGFIAQMARLEPFFHGNVQAALGYIYNELQRQSAMLAYLDIIEVIAVMCGLTGSLVFLLGKMEPPKDGPAMH
jgi:DHA2 family multidrug resistance protein